METEETSLANTGVEVIHRFSKAIDATSTSCTTDDLISQFGIQLQEERERFELFAANLSLIHTGHSSLDYRLRDADLIQSSIRRLLQDLIDSLEEASQLCGENLIDDNLFDPSRNIGEDSSTGPQNDEEEERLLETGYGVGAEGDVSAANLILESITDAIDRLFRLATKVRNPSTRQIASRVYHYKDFDETTGVNVIDEYAKFDRQHILELLVHRGQVSQEEPHHYLVDRLSHANTFRRQQFGYWRRRRKKLQHSAALSRSLVELVRGVTPGETDPSRAENTTPMQAPSNVATSKPYTASMLDPAKINVDDNQSTLSVSEYAPSARGLDNEPINWPLPPSELKGQKYFECPYCFTLCSSAYLERRAWKTHLLSDLRPYICTYEHCVEANRPYDTRKDWLTHESSVHRRVWRCLDHADMTFENRAAYVAHLQNQHPQEAQLQSAEMMKAGESTMNLPDRPCPFCQGELPTSSAMQDHIAYHLERIALFALPRSTGVDDESDDGAKGSADAAGQADDSRGDDFELDSLSKSSTESAASDSAIAGGSSGRYGSDPEPNLNAPAVPASAYMIFSNELREELKGKNETLSSTALARLLDDSWQKLDESDRRVYEAQAAAAKEEYDRQWTAYEKTDDYNKYLAKFEAENREHGNLIKMAKGPEDVTRPAVSQRSTSTSINDFMKDLTSVRDSKSTKLPRGFIAILEKRLTGVIMGQEKKHGYQDALVKRTFAVFLHALSGKGVKERMEHDREAADLIIIFFSRSTSELQKDKAPGDESVNLTVERHLALFVRLLILILEDNGWITERSELATRLATLERKLLKYDEETDFNDQMRQLAATKPLLPLEDPKIVQLLLKIQFLGMIIEGVPLPTTKVTRNRVEFPLEYAQTSPIAKMKLWADEYYDQWVPLCEEFVRNPPAAPKEREHSHSSVIDNVVYRVLLKLDGLDVEGDPEARSIRRLLVRDISGILQQCDKANEKATDVDRLSSLENDALIAEEACRKAQEDLIEQRSAIVEILDQFEIHDSRLSSADDSPTPITRPEYKGMPLGPETAIPDQSRSSFTLRQPLARIVELVLDLCDTAMEIDPAERAGKELSEHLRRLWIGSESRISQIRQWQRPSGLENEPGLAQLCIDTEILAETKVQAITRHREILEALSAIRHKVASSG